MRGFGGMLAFDLGSLEAARRLLNAVRLHALAESLGGVETLISHPATMTHASVPAERRAAIGITDGLVRISAGIEDIDDLEGRSHPGARSRSNDRLIDFLLHFDKHLLEFVGTYGSWVYAILFAIVFAETGFVVTPFLPGDSLLFAAGALCATGELSTPAAVRAAGRAPPSPATRSTTPSAGSSDRGCSRETGSHRLLNREYLDRAHAFFEQYGGKAIVLGRFVPIVRTFVPFVAGAAQMTPASFVLYNLVGAHRLGRSVPRRRLAVRQRPDREGQLLARDDRHRLRVGAADGVRARHEPTAPLTQRP